MRVLITAGPTHEPIDPVRFLGNRSSGRMGAALAEGALAAGHDVTLIVGPGTVPMPAGAKRMDIETAAQLHAAVVELWPEHDLLIMAAAVADYRPIVVRDDKLPRYGKLTIECEPTIDILADAVARRSPNQRVVGFSLETSGGIERATAKMRRKGVDLMVYNLARTLSATDIDAVLLWPNGRTEGGGSRSKPELADNLLRHAVELFDRPQT